MPHHAGRVPAPSPKRSDARRAPARLPVRRPPPLPVLAMSQARTASPAKPKPAPAAAPETSREGGLPARLRAGLEMLSGLFMGDVRVHRNSPEPAKLGALAYAKGADVHLGPGQERHLPHEAWHVVQQKQRRVAATTQMMGIEVNDDAGLEAEADRMGDRAAADRRAGATPLRAVPVAGPVAQAKLIHKGQPLGPSIGLRSNVIAGLHLRPETLILRDDWKPASPDSDIHLLDASRKYLLGERHDRSHWKSDVAQWSHVAKMEEGLSEIPEGGMHVAWSGKGPSLAMESTHAYLLQICLAVQDDLNRLCGPTPLSRASFGDFFTYFRAIYRESHKYSQFCANAAVPAGVKKPVCDFESRLQANMPLVRELDRAVTALWQQVIAPNFAQIALARRAFAPLFNRIEARRHVLTKISNDLRALMRISAGSTEGRLISAVAVPTHVKDEPRALLAGLAARERAMAAHIRAAAPPLLVGRLGDLHVESLGDAVGPSAVKIRMGQRLQDFTSFASDIWQRIKANILYRGMPPSALK